MKETKKEPRDSWAKGQSLITLSDGAKVLNGFLLPNRKQLRKWIAKNHPEYLEELKGES